MADSVFLKVVFSKSKKLTCQLNNARVAQLVEYDLAKVGVDGSSPFTRSNYSGKRVDHTYKWRNPSIIDKHPDFIEFLKTKPLYIDALYERKRMLKFGLNKGVSKRVQSNLLFAETAPFTLTLLP